MSNRYDLPLTSIAAVLLLSVPGLIAQTSETEPIVAQINIPEDPPAAVTAQPTTDSTRTDDGSTSEHVPNPLEDRRDRIYYPDDTERVKPLATKLLGNILLDQKEIWTSPFHMHKKDSPWWIGFGG